MYPFSLSVENLSFLHLPRTLTVINSSYLITTNMSADLEEMAQPPAADWVPSEAELSSSDRDERTRAWGHILKGKVLVPAGTPVAQGLEAVCVRSPARLPSFLTF